MAKSNSMGMCTCVIAGEAIAKRVLGEDVTYWMPQAFSGLSLERLTWLSVEKLEGLFPSAGV